MPAMRVFAYVLFMLGDIGALAGGFWVASQFRDAQWLSPQGVPLVLLAIPIYLIIAFNNSAYTLQALESASEAVRRPLVSLTIMIALIMLTSFFTQSGLLLSRFALGVAMGVAGLLIVVARLAVFWAYIARFAGQFESRLVIFDGLPVRPGLQDQASGVDLLNAERAGLSADAADPEKLVALSEIIRRYDRVVIFCSSERQADWALVLKGTNVTGEIILPSGNAIGAIGISEFAGQDTLIVSRGRLSLVNRLKKRAFDLAIAIPALVFLAPLLILVAILIKLDSKGPILFRQPRMGQNNLIFHILKFRSMKVEEQDEDGVRSTSRDDDRVTRLGRFIRKTSIDELPQLINVLQGEMSIVGPRPHALRSTVDDAYFWEVDRNYWIRHSVKPGITGLAQIRGFRGATHVRADLEDRLQSDLEYLNGWRLWRDVTILFATARVLTHRNAY